MKNRILNFILSFIMLISTFLSIGTEANADMNSIEVTDIENEIVLGEGYSNTGYNQARALYRKNSGGLTIGKEQYSWKYNTELQQVKSGDKVLPAFCIESFNWGKAESQFIVSIYKYILKYKKYYQSCNHESIPEAEMNVNKLRAIAFNSPLVLDLNEIRERTGIYSLKADEASRASQYAIWTYTDGLKIKKNKWGKTVAYYDCLQNHKPDKFSFYKTIDLQAVLTKNEEAYYNYLINLPEMESPIPEENILSEIDIVSNGDGTVTIKYDYLEGIEEPVVNFKSGRTDYEKSIYVENGRVYVELDFIAEENDIVTVEAIGNEYKDIAVVTGNGQAKIVIVPQKVVAKEMACIQKQEVYGEFKINKLDYEHLFEKLQDAEFTLYDQSGNIIDIKVTDYNGECVFTNLKPGNYILKETKPPQYYEIVGDNEYEVIVDNDGTTTVNGQQDEIIILNKYKIY
ncbi:MAG: prealbumin-like fold domain-containing protein [Andreesenia angusta]|nr:prealbumin-like fold domain-containing protein [Andreesenia angusta]